MEPVNEGNLLRAASSLANGEAQAAEAATMLRLTADERRLLILRLLIAEEAASAGSLVEQVGLLQPALPQRLAWLWEDGLVATRRTGTTIHHRTADPRAARIVAPPHDVFCLSAP